MKNQGYLVILKIDEWAASPREAAYLAINDIFRLYTNMTDDEDGLNVCVIPHDKESKQEFDLKIKGEL